MNASVLVRDVDKTFNNAIIQLPTKNGKIDFQFMESFISQLEDECMGGLSAYIKVSKLDDYVLTTDEKNVIKEYKSLCFKAFKISDIFNVLTPKKDLMRTKLKFWKKENFLIL